MSNFDEAKKTMGGEWFQGLETEYGEINPFKALDIYLLIYYQNGEETDIARNPEPIKYIKAVANMSDNDLLVWVNKQTMGDAEIIHKVSKDPLALASRYENFARDCRDKCRGYLGMDKLEPKKQ